jgi:hypothetical protein
MEECRCSSTILDLSIRWSISFTPLLIYNQEDSPLYPLDRMLGGPQSPHGHCVEEKNLLIMPESNPDSLAIQPIV